MFCKYCGKELPDTAVFCSKCGKQLVKTEHKTTIVVQESPKVESNESVEKNIEFKDIYTNGRHFLYLDDATKVFCPKCKKRVDSFSTTCSWCNTSFMTDTNEKSTFQENASVIHPTYTVSESHPIKQYTPTESSKSRLVAALLAFFLGEFGAHRFYVGKTTSGGIQLVLFIVGLILCVVVVGIVPLLISVIWSLIDFIIILCGSFKDKDGLPITDWDS